MEKNRYSFEEREKCFIHLENGNIDFKTENTVSQLKKPLFGLNSVKHMRDTKNPLSEWEYRPFSFGGKNSTCKNGRIIVRM